MLAERVTEERVSCCADERVGKLDSERVRIRWSNKMNYADRDPICTILYQ